MLISKPLSVFALLGLAAAAPSRIGARQDWTSIPAGESPANWGQWSPSPTSGSPASGIPSPTLPVGGKPSPSGSSPSGKPTPSGSSPSGKPTPSGSSPSEKPSPSSPSASEKPSPSSPSASEKPSPSSPSSSGKPTTNCNIGPAPGTTYTVVSGDTLSKIGDKYGVGICDIQKANPTQITNVNNIFPNEVLNIPSGLCSIDNTSCLPPPAQSCISTGQLSYTVVSGDTLTSIAAHFNITLQSLENANQQVTNPDLIQVGQILNLPQCICPSS